MYSGFRFVLFFFFFDFSHSNKEIGLTRKLINEVFIGPYIYMNRNLWRDRGLRGGGEGAGGGAVSVYT